MVQEKVLTKEQLWVISLGMMTKAPQWAIRRELMKEIQ
jgi:hypothetical protein